MVEIAQYVYFILLLFTLQFWETFCISEFASKYVIWFHVSNFWNQKPECSVLFFSQMGQDVLQRAVIVDKVLEWADKFQRLEAKLA